MSNNIYDILKKIESLEAPKKTNLTESKMTTVKELHNESKKEKQTHKGTIAEAVAQVEQQLNEKYMGFKKKLGEAQVNELSPDTLTRYADKAKGQRGWAFGRAQAGKEGHGSADPQGKFDRLWNKRADGYNQAVAKGARDLDKSGQKSSWDWSKDDTPAALKRDKGMAEGTVEESGLMYHAGVEKHGKKYMELAKKAGQKGASQEELGRLKDKHSKAYKNKKMDEGNYNEEMLSPKQKKIASMAGDPDKIDAKDFAALRGEKKGTKNEGPEILKIKADQAKAQGKDSFEVGDKTFPVKEGRKSMREGWEEMQKYLDKKRGPESKGGEGKKAGTRYGGSAQKDDDDEETDGEGKPVEKKKGRPKGTGGGAKFSFKKPKD